MDITDNKIEKINSFLLETLSPERYLHSYSTGKTTEKLCRKYDVDPEKGFFAGLVHDIAREMSSETLIKTCMNDGGFIKKQELSDPVLLHGRAGAVILREKFGITDEEILEAVKVHTTGARGMSRLAKILFIADYIEPKRKHITEDFLKTLNWLSLDLLVKSVLLSIMNYIRKEKKEISDSSVEMLEELEV